MSQPTDASKADGSTGNAKLLGILKKLLDSDLDLGFLGEIDEKPLEQLVAAIRARIEKER
jgi:hypothetical protein